MLSEEYILSRGSRSWREKATPCGGRRSLSYGLASLSCWSCLMLLCLWESSQAHLRSGTVISGLLLSSLAKEGIGPRGVGAEAWEMLGGAGAGTGRCLCSFTHPSPPPSSPETSDSATSSIGDAELWGPGPGRGESRGACSSYQAINQADPSAQGLQTQLPGQQS